MLPAVPAGRRIYAEGDVHGRLDLLLRLLSAIRSDSCGRGPADTSILLLGDVIDKGPDTARVIAAVSNWRESWAALDALKGNHEALLLALLDGRTNRLNTWLAMGGGATLLSYGFTADELRRLPIGEVIRLMRQRIPAGHQTWLRRRSTSRRIGDYLFVHAGVRPGIPLDEQADSDLLTIRSAFLESEAEHGAIVVHGHSRRPGVEVRHNRIGIDTGAVETGRLTALALQGSERWTLGVEGACAAEAVAELDDG